MSSSRASDVLRSGEAVGIPKAELAALPLRRKGSSVCTTLLEDHAITVSIRPPAQETVILGAVTGVIGNLQALEAIKIITGLHALGSPPFRNIKLRSRKPTCAACGIEQERIGTIQDIDYVQFCRGPRPDWEARGLEEGASAGARVRVKVRLIIYIVSRIV
ncbi:hypothetical protein DXG01_015617 [Tephrocybe rancida]|nr:hypothetical protein DXG01_015617 [Tephrocybe rancida]